MSFFFPLSLLFQSLKFSHLLSLFIFHSQPYFPGPNPPTGLLLCPKSYFSVLLSEDKLYSHQRGGIWLIVLSLITPITTQRPVWFLVLADITWSYSKTCEFRMKTGSFHHRQPFSLCGAVVFTSLVSDSGLS